MFYVSSIRIYFLCMRADRILYILKHTQLHKYFISSTAANKVDSPLINMVTDRHQ